MRQSAIANRTLLATSSNLPGSSVASSVKLLEKKKEFDAVSALERGSALYLERITSITKDCDIMVDAGRVHGQVLEQWPKMFQILSLFLSGQDLPQEKRDPDASPSIDGQRLVRVPIEDLQEIAAP